MAIKNLFKKKEAAPSTPAPEMQEKPVALAPPSFLEVMTPQTPRTPRSPDALSLRSSNFSANHELMVMDIFEKQLQRLWIGDASGQSEGAIIRTSPGNYVSCPPQLVSSPLGNACADLNLQVRYLNKHTLPDLS